MEKLLFILVAALLVFAVARWSIIALCASRRAKEIEKRICSEEVLAATLFWYYALMRDWEPRKPLNEAQLSAFRNNLQTMLATEYVDTGAYPDIGVFYHAPHNYGVHPLLIRVAQASGIVSGDILQSMLPSIRMRISPERIALRRLSDSYWTVAWMAGDGAGKMIDLGKEKCPRRSPSIAGSVTSAANAAPATSTSSATERCDGWCGWCGAVFIDQPGNEPANCTSCGNPLNENPPDGPVRPLYVPALL